MNIDANKMHAAASVDLCRRYSLVRPLALALMLTGALAANDHAGPGKNEREQQRQAEQQQQQQQQNDARQARQAEAQRQFDSRAFEARAEERRRYLQLQQEQNAQSAEAMRRSGRLTPDEKRDLRRQINEAGLDIYPNAPRR
jgi:hypothetical protein